LPTFDEGGVHGRLIAGEALGLKARVKTHSPLFYLHLQLQQGVRTTVPAEYTERAVYVASGAVRLGDARLGPGQMAVLAPGMVAEMVAEAPSVVMVLGGEPVGP